MVPTIHSHKGIKSRDQIANYIRNYLDKLRREKELYFFIILIQYTHSYSKGPSGH